MKGSLSERSNSLISQWQHKLLGKELEECNGKGEQTVQEYAKREGGELNPD